jgi:hypothetical protein
MTVPEKKEVQTSQVQKKSTIIHDCVVSIKTITFLVFATLVCFGIFYITNWEVKISPRVQIVSPLVTK